MEGIDKGKLTKYCCLDEKGSSISEVGGEPCFCGKVKPSGELSLTPNTWDNDYTALFENTRDDLNGLSVCLRKTEDKDIFLRGSLPSGRELLILPQRKGDLDPGKVNLDPFYVAYLYKAY